MRAVEDSLPTPWHRHNRTSTSSTASTIARRSRRRCACPRRSGQPGEDPLSGRQHFAAWQVAKALGLAALHGWARFEVLEPMYTWSNARPRSRSCPWPSPNAWASSPTALWAGDCSPASTVWTDARTRAGWYRMRCTPNATEMRGSTRRLRPSRPLHVTTATIPSAWRSRGSSHPAVTAPIIGARSVVQLEGSLGALDIDMTPDLRAAISALSIEPPPATDRAEDVPATSSARSSPGSNPCMLLRGGSEIRREPPDGRLSRNLLCLVSPTPRSRLALPGPPPQRSRDCSSHRRRWTGSEPPVGISPPAGS